MSAREAVTVCDLCRSGLVAGDPARCGNCGAPPLVAGGQDRAPEELSADAWSLLGTLVVLGWVGLIVAVAVRVLS